MKLLSHIYIVVNPTNFLPRMFPGLWVLARFDSVGYPFPRALLSGWHEEWAKGPFVIWWCSYLTRPFRGRGKSGDRESERGKNAPRNMGESKEKEERAKKYWGKKWEERAWTPRAKRSRHDFSCLDCPVQFWVCPCSSGILRNGYCRQ